ncbi:MAG TPA: head GIN domain-containing protein [Cyclobacteriaceae bacterium]|nr:head GIN domain-containing protein [Cyclobacteriaceae bacterium]
MKKVGILVLFVLTACGAIAQESETRALAAFRGIRVGEAIDLYLKKGDKESAKVEVENVKLSDVVTEVSGSYLRIHMRSGNYHGRRTVKVYLTYVTLEKLSASSASSVFSEGIVKTPSLDLAVASAANVELQLEAGDVTVDVASAGDITLEGKAKNLSIEASSAGSVDAYNFECEKVEATVSSAGSAKINVTKTLDANASSGGSIRYRGNPGSTNTDSSSGGSVKRSI